MPESSNSLHARQSDDSRKLATWTRRYAQNRSLGVVVFLLMCTLVFCAIGGTSYLAGQAYRSNNMLLLAGCLVLLVAALAANLYLAVPKWGGELVARINQRLYSQEGQVAISSPTRVKQRWMLLPVVCFGGCVVASVLLGDRIPVEYRQPVMALYCVPFLTLIAVLQKPTTSFVALLWPFLFGLHAILILAGVPIVFSGRWQSLNILLPVVGYGMLSGIAAHLYSRFALSRIKRLAHANNGGHSADG